MSKSKRESDVKLSTSHQQTEAKGRFATMAARARVLRKRKVIRDADRDGNKNRACQQLSKEDVV
jgi:hypothetical protein